MKKAKEEKIIEKSKRNVEKLKSSNKGITLIALVITIVLNAIAWSKDGKYLLKYEKTLANTVNPL